MKKLKISKKSKVIETGYINIYSQLTPQERRQLFYHRRYKKLRPSWDNTLIILCKKFRKAVRKIKKIYQVKKITILDAGCGHGNYVIDENRDLIKKACGIDLEPKFTKKNICLDEIKYANLEKIPYPDSSFHLVISLWVIEHLEYPKKVFQEIYRVLKPGGFFLAAVPNSQCLLVQLKKLIDRSRRFNKMLNKLFYGREAVDVFPTYYKATTISGLQNHLRQAGFEKINLQLNYDPGYTSFNKLTFAFSNLANDIFAKFAPQLYQQHLICQAQKPVNS